MLDRLAEIVPRGRVLVGDGCWPAPPTPAAHTIFGDDVLPLAELAPACADAGWQVLHLSTAAQREWDDFESRHRAGPREWLLANADDPRAAEVRERPGAGTRVPDGVPRRAGFRVPGARPLSNEASTVTHVTMNRDVESAESRPTRW